MSGFGDLPAEDLEPPVGLTLEQRKGTHWEGELNGSVKTLLDWLQGRGIEDLEIGPPGLETLFRVLYQQGAAS